MPNVYTTSRRTSFAGEVTVELVEDAPAEDALVLPRGLPLGRGARIEWRASGEHGLGTMQARFAGELFDEGSGLRERLEDPPPAVAGYDLVVRAGSEILFGGTPDHDGQARDLGERGRAYDFAFRGRYAADLDEPITPGRDRPWRWINWSQSAQTQALLGGSLRALHRWQPYVPAHGTPSGSNRFWLERITLDPEDYGADPDSPTSWGELLAEVGERHLFTVGYSYRLGGVAAVYARAHSRRLTPAQAGAQGQDYAIVDETYRGGSDVTLSPPEHVLYREGRYETEARRTARIVDADGATLVTRERVVSATPRDDYEHTLAGEAHLFGSNPTEVVTTLNAAYLSPGDFGNHSSLSLHAAMGQEIYEWRLGYKRRLRGCLARGFVDPMLPFLADVGEPGQPDARLYRVVRCTWDLALGLTTGIEAVEIQ